MDTELVAGSATGSVTDSILQERHNRETLVIIDDTEFIVC